MLNFQITYSQQSLMTYYFVDLGVFCILVSVGFLLWLRDKDSDEYVQTNIGTYTQVSVIRGSCVFVFVVGIIFIGVGLVINV
jgi:hypothetical protein